MLYFENKTIDSIQFFSFLYGIWAEIIKHKSQFARFTSIKTAAGQVEPRFLDLFCLVESFR